MMRLAMSGLRVLGVLVLLGPAVAFACRPGVIASEWARQTPDGHFELSYKDLGGSRQIALHDRRKDVVLWTQQLPGSGDTNSFLLAPDGSAVLLIKGEARSFTLFGRAGETLGTWRLEDLLTPSELERIPHVKTCDYLSWWVNLQPVAGNTFSFVVLVGDALGYLINESRHIDFELSTTGQLKREPARLDGTPSELIQRYRKERSPLVRLQIADELWMASTGKEAKPGPELPAFWLEVLKDPLTPRGVLSVAVQSLEACGTEADLRSLSQLPPGALERDIAILGLLAKKLPEEMSALAVRMLERPHPSAQVRAAAIHHLLAQGGTAAQRGSAFLKRDAATFRSQHVSPDKYADFMGLQCFWQTFPFCAGPTERRKAMAARAMQHVLDGMDGFSPALLEMSDTFEASSKGDCPGVLLSLGMLAERNKDTTRAARLYRAGLAGLTTASAEQQKDAQALRLEAKLRLAVLSQGDERQRLVGEVLADPARSTEVCPSRPFGSGEYWSLGSCSERKPAEAVARQILLQERSQDSKH